MTLQLKQGFFDAVELELLHGDLDFALLVNLKFHTTIAMKTVMPKNDEDNFFAMIFMIPIE